MPPWWHRPPLAFRSANPDNSLEQVTEYMVTIWRPGGNLPPVLIEYDLMRSRVEARAQGLGMNHRGWEVAPSWLLENGRS